MTMFFVPFAKLVLAKLQRFHSIRCIELDVLTRYLSPRAGEKIIDVGCGKGFYCDFLHKRGIEAHGIDPSKRDIAFAQIIQHKGIHVQVAEGEDIPYKNSEFDRAVSVCVLEHTRDDKKVLQEVHRVLKKNGTFALSVDTLDSPNYGEAYRAQHAKEHFVNQYYTREKLMKLLQSTGFEVVETQYLFGSNVATRIMHLGSFFHFGLWFLVLFPIIYPILWIDHQLNRNLSHGMILVVHARKASK